jgi:UDP-2-acetamido-2,6-beta-L-arabino-hexul-4-ose reductase
MEERAMKILVTGAKGFVGKNLCWALKNILAGKDKTHPGLSIEAVYEYDLDSTPEELDIWCKEADFVFNLAGVNRPQTKRSSCKATSALPAPCWIH